MGLGYKTLRNYAGMGELKNVTNKKKLKSQIQASVIGVLIFMEMTKIDFCMGNIRNRHCSAFCGASAQPPEQPLPYSEVWGPCG